MAFRFPLEPLLRLRRSQQRQMEPVLQKKTSEVNRLQLTLTRTEAEMARVFGLPPHSRSAAEIQFDQELLRSLAFRRTQIEHALRGAITDRDLALAEIRCARQHREMLETLQQHAREAYTLEESRRAQRALDDWFAACKHTS